MAKDTWSISLTQTEWSDLLNQLRENDSALAETIIEQIDEQLEKGRNND